MMEKKVPGASVLVEELMLISGITDTDAEG